MAQKKVATKSSKSSNGASGKTATGKQARKTANSKSSRNGAGLTANELTLLAWEKIYENHKKFGKLD